MVARVFAACRECSRKAGFRPGFVGRGPACPGNKFFRGRRRSRAEPRLDAEFGEGLRIECFESQKGNFRLKTKVMQLRVRYAYDSLLFRSHVESFLAEREAENNLVFGILAGVTDGMQKFSHDRPLFVSVGGNVGIQLVAVRTPPFNLVLSTAKKDEAVSFLAREMHAEGHQLPGVTASSREADVFARAWSGISGSKVRREHSQRIYRLDRAIPPRLVAGHLHSCDEPDIHQATEWMRAFNRDVGENQIAGRS